MKIKKILFINLVVAITLSIFLFQNIAPTHAKLGDSGVIKTLDEEIVTNLLGGVELHQQNIEALKDCQGNYYYQYDSQYLVTQPNCENVKIVSWSYRHSESWKMNGVTEIAKNFEENNPGWIVVGGTNADFFHINGNGQMDGNAMENGELINARNDRSNPYWRGILGFTKENELITGIPEMTDYYTAHIYDNKEAKDETSSLQIASINPGSPSEKGITVLTKDAMQQYNLTGYKVLVGRYEIVRKSTTNDYFVKGEIIESRDGTTGERPLDLKSVYDENGQLIREDLVQEFFMVAKDDSLDTLKIGDFVKVQRDYIGKYAEVYNAASYWWKILENEKVMFEGHSNPAIREEIIAKYGQGYSDLSYITCTKSRCLFGVKADGSYVMTVIGGSTSSGMTLSEAAYFMKEIGCVDAWDFDGGGSATLVARLDDNQIHTINKPSDSGGKTERRVGNALLMVVRDSGFEVNQKTSTASTITLEKKKAEDYLKMQDITIELNGKIYTLENDQTSISISGLIESTTYNATIRYTYEGEQFTTVLPIQTKKYNPGIDINPTSNGFEISIRETDPNIRTSKIILDVEGQKYTIDNTNGDVKTYFIEDLLKDETYRIGYLYEGTVLENNATFERTVEAEAYTTLAYEIPTVKKFDVTKSRGNVNISYGYEDPDGIVIKTYILFNGNTYEIEEGVTRGTMKFENVDFSVRKNVFQYVIEYEYEQLGGVVRTEEYVFDIVHEHVYKEADCTHAKTCTTCGETEGEPLGHNWKEADCTHAKTCTRCNETEGEPLGHTYKEADCTHAKTCTRCNETEGEPLGHTWKEATKKEPKTCSVCGQTEGEPVKGCKKASAMTLIISILTLTTTLMILRKKR